MGDYGRRITASLKPLEILSEFKANLGYSARKKEGKGKGMDGMGEERKRNGESIEG